MTNRGSGFRAAIAAPALDDRKGLLKCVRLRELRAWAPRRKQAYVPPAAENGEPRLARLRSGRSNCGSRASAAVSGMMESAEEWRQLGHDAVVALQRILGGRDGLRRRNSAAVLRERVQCSEIRGDRGQRGS